eukprot:scaffold99600_cov44-Attheya_sp.AAC.4
MRLFRTLFEVLRQVPVPVATYCRPAYVDFCRAYVIMLARHRRCQKGEVVRKRSQKDSKRNHAHVR